MMGMFQYDPRDSEWAVDDDTTSAYQEHLKQCGVAKQIEKQIRKHGDEQSRVAGQRPVGADDGMQPFERSYFLNMKDAKAKKAPAHKDPCKNLLKAMRIPMMDQKAQRKHAYADS